MGPRQMPDDRAMAIHEILKMGDARLLRVAPPVKAFNTPELHAHHDVVATQAFR